MKQVEVEVEERQEKDGARFSPYLNLYFRCLNLY